MSISTCLCLYDIRQISQGLKFPLLENEDNSIHLSHRLTKSESISLSVVSNSLQPHGLQPTRVLHLWDFPDIRLWWVLNEIIYAKYTAQHLVRMCTIIYSLCSSVQLSSFQSKGWIDINLSLNSGYSGFSSVQSLSRVRFLATPWIAARQASLSITNSHSSLRFRSIESVMPSSHLILCRVSCPQSLPASESFPMSQLFA